MELFTWRPDYEIDITNIDEQHKSLVGMINDLYQAKVDGNTEPAIDRTLDRLLEYVHVHFRDEEAVMMAWDYPGTEEHIKQHRELEKSVLGLKAKQVSGRGVATFELLSFLSEWFKTHIIDSDMMIGTFIVQQGQGNRGEM